MSVIEKKKPTEPSRYVNWTFTLSPRVPTVTFNELPIASQVFTAAMRYIVLTKEYDEGRLYVKGFVSYKRAKSLKYVKDAFNGSVATIEPTTSVVKCIKDIRRGIFTEAGSYVRKGPARVSNRRHKETIPKIIKEDRTVCPYHEWGKEVTWKCYKCGKQSENTVLISDLSVPAPELILAIANEPEETN